jgi:hypothetical protein
MTHDMYSTCIIIIIVLLIYIKDQPGDRRRTFLPGCCCDVELSTSLPSLIYHRQPIPTNQDTLRYLDVGRQSNERKKWGHHFENVTALMFW